MWFKDSAKGDMFTTFVIGKGVLCKTCWGESTSSESESFFFSVYKQNKNKRNTKLSNKFTDNAENVQGQNLQLSKYAAKNCLSAKISSYSWCSNIIAQFTTNNKPFTCAKYHFVQAVLFFGHNNKRITKSRYLISMGSLLFWYKVGIKNNSK